MSGPEGWGHRSAGVGLWMRLVLLVLVPVLALSWYAAEDAVDHHVIAAQTAQAARDAAEAATLADLHFTLHEEMLYDQIELAIVALGLTPQAASDLVGFDLAAAATAARAATDEVLAMLDTDLISEHPSLDEVEERLDAFRDAATRPGADYLTLGSVLDGVFHDVRQVSGAELAQLEDQVHGTSDNGLEGLVASLGGVTDVGSRLIDVTVALLSVPFPSEREAIEPVRALTEANTAYRIAADDLEAGALPVVAGSWAAVSEEPSTARLEAAIEGALTQTDYLQPTPGDFSRLAATFTDAQVVLAGARGLVSDTGELVVAAAQESAGEAGRAVDRARAALALAFGVTLLLSALVAWSIRRPLQQLGDRARRLGAGDLGLQPPLRTSLRDAQIIAGALDEATEHLRRTEEQAEALAEGRLFDPVLQEPVAGPIGASLQRSVDKLSESLRAQDELQQRLTHLAMHDPLTGLPNRAGVLTALTQALGRARRSKRQVALLFLDLDGFKQVNDAHGHAAGDALLRACGTRLAHAVRAGDVAARLGGDEFLVIAEPIDDIAEGLALGERLIRELSEPVPYEGRQLRVGVSIGLALDGGQHADGLALLRDADVAVHRAKDEGKGRVVVFDEAVHRELLRRAQVEEALRHGIADGELRVHYQPIVASHTGELRSLEALVRWEPPGGRTLLPGSFIPIAEESDLIVDLEVWVLDRVLSDLEDWAASGEVPRVPVAVNVSGRHLVGGRLTADVRRTLAAHDVDPSMLIVEITETVLVSDLDRVVATLDELRALGVRVALDDFGTGYTSLGMLCHMPLDELKIDGSFVQRMGELQQRSIVEVVIELASTLGLDLVAEGVEDEAQLAMLRRMGCRSVQGFLIARPLEAADVGGWVLANEVSAASITRRY